MCVGRSVILLALWKLKLLKSLLQVFNFFIFLVLYARVLYFINICYEFVFIVPGGNKRYTKHCLMKQDTVCKFNDLSMPKW